MDPDHQSAYDENDQLLAYLAMKVAKLDAMLSVALPALFVANQKRLNEIEPAGADQAAAEAFADMHVALTKTNLTFLCEQFPRIARSMKCLASLNERDILAALEDHDQ